jgi:hypothetical protein
MPPPVAPTLALAQEPERAAVRVSVGVPAGALTLSVWRVGPSGTPAFVRGWEDASVTAGASLVIRDYEAPLDVALNYYASASNASGEGPPSSVQTITVASNGNDWLCDLARPANSRPVYVEALDVLAHEAPHGIHRVLARRDPVVAADIAWTWTSELRFLTLTDIDRDGATNALGNGVPVLLKTSPARGVGNAYLFVTAWDVQRVARIAMYAERRFVCNVTQVQRPSPSLYAPTPPMDYAELKAAFATYADLEAERDSYDDAMYDYSAADPESPTEWLPVDV